MIRRPRLGCLGSLGVVALCVAALIAMAPWTVRIGGGWTPLGYWTGLGEVRSASGSRYGLYLNLSPYFHGRVSPLPSRLPRYSLRGQAYVCTAQGRTFHYKLGGAIYGVYLNTDGADVHLYFTGPQHQLKGSFDLRGTWRGPELLLQDRGSFDLNFGSGGKRAASPAAVTLHRGSFGEFEALCRNQIGGG